MGNAYPIILTLFILVFIALGGIEIVKIRTNRKLKKQAEEVIVEAEKNFKFWSDKLLQEQQQLQNALDIINRQYYEYVQDKRTNNQTLFEELKPTDTPPKPSKKDAQNN